MCTFTNNCQNDTHNSYSSIDNDILDEKCSICSKGSNLVRSKCTHYYHLSCIDINNLMTFCVICRDPIRIHVKDKYKEFYDTFIRLLDDFHDKAFDIKTKILNNQIMSAEYTNIEKSHEFTELFEQNRLFNNISDIGLYMKCYNEIRVLHIRAQTFHRYYEIYLSFILTECSNHKIKQYNEVLFRGINTVMDNIKLTREKLDEWF